MKRQHNKNKQRHRRQSKNNTQQHKILKNKEQDRSREVEGESVGFFCRGMKQAETRRK